MENQEEKYALMVRIRDVRFIRESELEAVRGDLGLNPSLRKYRQQDVTLK